MSTATTTREPAPIAERDRILPAVSFRAPSSPAEHRLAGLWQAALNIDRIGVDDDFFALGGESMAATVICAEVQRFTGRRTEPTLLLEAPTIAAFAMAVEGDPRLDAERCLIAIRPGGDRPPLVLIHGLDGQIMFVRRLAWLMPPQQPVYAVQARGLAGNPPAYRNGQHLVEDYADEIAGKLDRRQIYLGGYCMGGAIAVGVSHALEARGIACHGLVLLDPPVEKVAREAVQQQRALLREWYDTLAERMAPFVRWHPELAAHYGPEGEGLRHAQAVMRSLISAYSMYWPPPTSIDTTVIWSEERARQRGGHQRPYKVAQGPYHGHVIARHGPPVDHKTMMRDATFTLASIIRPAIGLPPLERPRPAA